MVKNFLAIAKAVKVMSSIKVNSKIMKKLLAYVDKTAPKKHTTLLKEFACRFYGTISPEDLEERDLLDLYGAMYSLWEFVNAHPVNDNSVRVYNPSHEKHSWQSTHTIVEVIHDDMPFLVDTISMEINREDMLAHLIIHTGCIYFERDANGKVLNILDEKEAKKKNVVPQAVIYLEVDRQIDPKILKKLQKNIATVLRDVVLAVSDWRPMCSKVEEAISSLNSVKERMCPEETQEAINFLQWALNNHFTFLGSRDYSLVGSKDNQALEPLNGTSLGVLKDKVAGNFSKGLAALPPRVRAMMLSDQVLIIAKTNTISSVHRRAYTDYIGVKCFDEKRNVVGVKLFIGLYTSAAYYSNPRYIPFLSGKVSDVLERTAFSPTGHSGKALLNILETLPRDDLFQASVDELYDLSMGILHLQERQRARLFVRKDSYNRYYSCLVYIPRDVFHTDLRVKIQGILVDAFDGVDSTFTTLFSEESILARIHIVVRVDPNKELDVDYSELEKFVIAMARSWQDDLRTSLVDYFGEAKGIVYFAKYKNSFQLSYQESYTARTAVHDIEHMEKLIQGNELEMSFCQSIGDDKTAIQFKIYNPKSACALSDVLPILENMGLRVIGENPNIVSFPDGTKVWVNDFHMQCVEGIKLDIDTVRVTFQEAFSRIWSSYVENDSFNKLILTANLSWKETALLRTFARYLKQLGFTFSQGYIAATLYNNPKVTRELITLFKALFDPGYDGRSERLIERLVGRVEKELDNVSSLDEDRIIRRFLKLILATLRTNFFLKEARGAGGYYVSLKFDPSKIPEMPLPLPMYEIFVYSPKVEGVHLRGAKVARGGLRWSDRREDYRTEVLGLMKAQQVKNAVIVPLGAKGGFVAKQLPNGPREAVMEEVIFCYQTFIRGLLDLTDNIVDGKIVNPKNVVRYDEDDPYLVVAADKGTATFSDIANAISQEYGFWLGDAFASGGSTGYDHKKMGITAKGAWESAKRSFREMFDINTQAEDFTVIGVGDMAGDVFGNGMLLSKHIRLVAAFNHMHIFIDPNPDAATSYVERERLFNLPRSTWSDYDAKLLSKGGAIYSRSDKSLTLTKEIMELLGLEHQTIVPNDLIKALLKTPVDMFWNGGIGTFVKASAETDMQVGDRASDGIRIDALDLGCKVVVEGGNLGLTQKARIEFAENGGRINTDFIDNSAGVDCSDHEVNIKILLNSVVRNGDLTQKQRNKLLADMTDEVSELVLNNNYLQTETLSLEEFSAAETIDLFQRYVVALEKKGKINRELECLPSDEEIAERKALGQGFTRPEIAVLMAYDKTLLKEQILDSDLPEDPYFLPMLYSAFPKVLCEKYKDEMNKHSLRREIIATQLSNCVTNAMGINFVSRLHVETGAPVPFIVRVYMLTQELFGLEDIWSKIRELDCKVNSKIQFAMILQIYFLARRSTRWFLRNYAEDFEVGKVLLQFQEPLAVLKKNILKVLTKEQNALISKKKASYLDCDVPAPLADEISRYLFMFNALDILQGANESGAAYMDVAKVYFMLSTRLDLNWLREKIISHKIDSQWDELARSVLLDDVDYQQRVLAINVLEHHPVDKKQSIDKTFDKWCDKYSSIYSRWKSFLGDVLASQGAGYIMYAVVMRELYDLARAGKELKA